LTYLHELMNTHIVDKNYNNDIFLISMIWKMLVDF